MIDSLHEANQAPLMPRSQAKRCMLFSLGPLALAGIAYVATTAALLLFR